MLPTFAFDMFLRKDLAINDKNILIDSTQDTKDVEIEENNSQLNENMEEKKAGITIEEMEQNVFFFCKF